MAGANSSVRIRLSRLEEAARPQGDFGGRLQRAVNAAEASPDTSEARMQATLARLRTDPPGRLRDRLLRAYERWALEA